MSASPRPSRSRASAHECPAQQRPPHKRQSSKRDRKSTRLNSSHSQISYAVFCLKKNSEIRTVGAAHIHVMRSRRITSNTRGGSTLRRQTCVAPAAVTTHLYVQPLAWNIGGLHR